jgi:hypothetical protein
MAALSDSTVMSDCSILMASPGLTKISMTATSLKSPISGTWTSMGPLARGAATTGAGAATEATTTCTGGAAAAGALAGKATSPLASTINTTEPCLTLSPNFTRSSFTTPAVEEGISIDALSDSTVIKDCSAFTVSPTLTNSSMTATSSKSPMSGTLTSTNAICVSKSFYQAYKGLILSILMSYCFNASATLATGTAPSSLKALSAATTM